MRWLADRLDARDNHGGFRLSFHVLGAFDESGKFRDHKIVAFCGLLGLPAEWNNLQLDWDALLRRHSIPSLHMSGGMLNFRRKLSPGRPALGKEARIEVINEFIRAIKKHIEVGITIAIDVEAFMSLPDHLKSGLGGDPHYLAFSVAMVEVLEYMKANKDAKACITCDDEEKYFIECYKLLARFRRENVTIRDKFAAMSAVDDREFPEVQAADLLAYVSRCEAGRVFLGIPYDFQELHAEFDREDPDAKLRFSPGSGFWGKDRLRSYCERVMKRRK